MHVVKKKEIFDCRVFRLQRFSIVFPNVGEKCSCKMSKNWAIKKKLVWDSTLPMHLCTNILEDTFFEKERFGEWEEIHFLFLNLVPITTSIQILYSIWEGKFFLLSYYLFGTEYHISDTEYMRSTTIWKSFVVIFWSLTEDCFLEVFTPPLHSTMTSQKCTIQYIISFLPLEYWN